MPATFTTEKFSDQFMRISSDRILTAVTRNFLRLLVLLATLERHACKDVPIPKMDSCRYIKVCGNEPGNDQSKLPVIYVITPTYSRAVQKAELTRLSHTFSLVPALHWVLVEDSNATTPLVRNLLARTTIKHTLLNAPTPQKLKPKKNESRWRKPRGVVQRNRGLQWIRGHLKAHHRAVIYFADDDNVYSLDIFEEMRGTKGVSVWPVGLVGELKAERPLLDPRTGRVAGWNAYYRPERPFALDMAGFAVSSSLLLSKPNATFSLDAKEGYQESWFLKMLTSKEELEPKADNCTKVYVWHTRTQLPLLNRKERLGNHTYIDIEV